jgi:hypothetical protein
MFTLARIVDPISSYELLPQGLTSVPNRTFSPGLKADKITIRLV